MHRSLRNRVAATVIAGAALALTAGPVAAVTPSTESWTNHVEIGFIDCDGFTVVGTWDIHHKLTTFYGADGVPIRDIEQIDFSGRLTNAVTGASVPDGGARSFFDTLAPDGSFLTTYSVQVRKSAYVHTAGRLDFQSGDFHGVDGFAPANIAALCEALGG
jgi:hypothetical protein